MTIIYSMSFGKVLKQLRVESGFTQEEFAQKIGITQTAVAHYERDARKPEMEKLPEIARVLNVAIEELFRDMPHTNVAPKEKRVHKNSKSVKIQELFNKLSPAKQQTVFTLVKDLQNPK